MDSWTCLGHKGVHRGPVCRTKHQPQRGKQSGDQTLLLQQVAPSSPAESSVGGPTIPGLFSVMAPLSLVLFSVGGPVSLSTIQCPALEAPHHILCPSTLCIGCPHDCLKYFSTLLPLS
jgi:hypothetical protein